MSKRLPKIISAANELSHYCYSRYKPDGKCKCPFWEKYPYGHCVLHVPACWPISRIKENAPSAAATTTECKLQ
ncbi:MAG: hypothetical protein Q4P20_10900 [Eubacteriales bacterium]|nr:hypothetical protein [Eubacteriales bacterium]